MSEKFIISGGIILSLLFDARMHNPKSANMSINENNYLTDNPCDTPKLLAFTAGIADKKYHEVKLKKTASQYKNCNGQGGLGIDKPEYQQIFNLKMKNEYDSLVLRARLLFQECICNLEESRLQLANRLYWLLENSSKDYKFTYLNKKDISKDEFLKIRHYDFVPFFLAIWHSITTTTTNNKISRQTFLKLFSYEGERNDYRFTYGDVEPSRKVSFYNVLNPEEPIVINDDNDDDDKEEIKKESKDKEPETHEETYTEIIEPNNDSKDAKVINQRVINLNGGNYFEHVENLILKEDD